MKSNKFKVFLVLIGALLIGIGYAVYPDLSSGKFQPVKQVSALFKSSPETHYVEIEPITTNLKPTSLHKKNYISLHLTFEILGDDDLEDVKEKEHLIRDAIVNYLGSQSTSDLLLRDDEELSTKEYLVQNLEKILNEELNSYRDVIKGLYITDMFIQ